MRSPDAMPVVVAARGDLEDALEPARRDGRQIALVPTMGALHDGHRALIMGAREVVGRNGLVCVSIFVNPLQFGEGEDLDRYPRTLAADLDACAAEGVDVVWTPEVSDVYRDPESGISIDPGPLGLELEGAVRPTHFRGVLTVVATLLGAVRPQVAVFGEKDYQQLVLVQSMVRSLAMDVRVLGLPIIREEDGLALSSRNRYLDAEQRVQAAGLLPAMHAGSHPQVSVLGAGAIVEATKEALIGAGFEIDYVAVRTPDLRHELEHDAGRLLVAVRVGTTRLIDNCPVYIHRPEERAPASENSIWSTP